MADNIIGDIAVRIAGDYSQLNSDLTESSQLAESGAQKIADAFNAGAPKIMALEDAMRLFNQQGTEFDDRAGRITGDLTDIVAAAQAALAPVVSLDQAMAQFVQSAGDKAISDNLTKGLEDFGATAGQVLPKVTEDAQAATNATGDLLKTLLGFAGIEIGLSALKSFAVDALETYAAVEKATISITALTHSAEAAEGIIGGLKDLALQDALSFPALVTAQQRMIAFGFSAQSIPGALRTIADTAAATGREFGSVANVFERVVETGNLESRILIQLGINLKDVATALHTTSDAAKDAFAALDQSQRVAVLRDALSKFGGTAEAVALGLSGQWQTLRTQFDLTLGDVGKAVAPAASALIQLATAATKSADLTVQAFGSFTSSAQHLATSVAESERQVISTSPTMQSWADKVMKAGTEADFTGVKTSALSGILALTIPPLELARTGMETFATALDLWNGKAPDTNKLLEVLHVNLNNLTHSSTTSGAAFKDAMTNAGASLGVQNLTDKSHALYSQIDLLQREISILQTQQDGSKEKALALAIAQDDLAKKTKALTGILGDHGTAMKAIETDYKTWASAFDGLGKSAAGINDIISRANAAATGGSRTVIGSLKSQADALNQWMTDLATDYGKTSNVIDVLTGHTHDVDQSTLHFGTSISVVKTDLDDAAGAAKKFVDASSPIADQLASGMTTLTGHTNSLRDSFGMLKSTAADAGDTASNGLYAAYMAAERATSGVDDLSAALISAENNFSGLNQAADSLASKSSRSGGHGSSLSGQLGFTGTPAEMLAQYNANIAFLQSFASNSAILGGGVPVGIADAMRQSGIDYANSVANYYATHPDELRNASGSSSASSGGGSSSAPVRSSSSSSSSAVVPPAGGGPIGLGYNPNNYTPIDTGATAPLTSAVSDLSATLGTSSDAIVAAVAQLAPVVEQASTQIVTAVQASQASVQAIMPALQATLPATQEPYNPPSFATIPLSQSTTNSMIAGNTYNINVNSPAASQTAQSIVDALMRTGSRT